MAVRIPSIQSIQSEPGQAKWELAGDPDYSRGWAVPSEPWVTVPDPSQEVWACDVGLQCYARRVEYRLYPDGADVPEWVPLPAERGPSAGTTESLVPSRSRTTVELPRGDYLVEFRIEREGRAAALCGLAMRVPARWSRLAAGEICGSVRFVGTPVPDCVGDLCRRFGAGEELPFEEVAEALDLLESCGTERAVRIGFWRRLEKAALYADLPDRRQRYRATFQRLRRAPPDPDADSA